MANPTVQQLFDLHGRVAIVTGVRNLGYDAAEALAELGASVVVTTRDKERSEAVAKKLSKEKNVTSVGMKLEVTDEMDWKEVVEETVKQFGKIDILVNNAGGRSPSLTNSDIVEDMSIGFLEGRSVESWKSTVNVNLTSVFLGCRAVAPYMKKERYGKIINMASADGMVGRDLNLYKGTGISPTVPDYLASKAGVINLTRGVAVVLAPFGINVNSISPAGFFRGHRKEFVGKYTKLIPLGRMARDGIDLKGAIAYLASNASDFVVGHNLVMDGGWTAW